MALPLIVCNNYPAQEFPIDTNATKKIIFSGLINNTPEGANATNLWIELYDIKFDTVTESQ
jgi:hypothetical protein